LSVSFVADGAHTWSVILLSVQDSGPGISPSDQARLFQNFVQIRPDQLQRGAGSGLGLTIAKQIVELHGGRIGVTSTEGHGSLFFFSIPFQKVGSK
jgi:signal transduction histidine kinase